MPSDESELESLVSLCERLAGEGKPVHPAELCAGKPGLLPELERRLETLKRFQRLAGPGAESGRGSGPPPSLSFLEPAQQPDEFGRLGPFRVLRLLGWGGMGVVLACDEPALGRQVAVKVIKAETAAMPDNRKRFLREARAAAGIDNPHVVAIHRVEDPEGGLPYLVMPLLPGEPLSARLGALKAEGRRMPPAEAVRIARQMAEGLAAAHAKDVVHRDIKPSNVWLRAPEGTAILLDFGLATAKELHGELTWTGQLLGTPSFMAPEQARGEAVDGRADLFSLGCVLYEMLTGERAFAGNSTLGIMAQLATHMPPLVTLRVPGLPEELGGLVRQLLAKERHKRPATAMDAAQRLRSIEGRPHADDAPTQPTQPTPARTQRVRVLAGFAVGAAVLTATLALALWLAPAARTTPLEGAVAVRAYKPEGKPLGSLIGSDPDAVPVREEDGIRIEASYAEPVHAYIVWIDPTGKVAPLYPWNPGDRLDVDRPGPLAQQPPAVREVCSPANKENGWPLDDTAGLETVLVLARRTPLPAGVDLGDVLGKLPPARFESPTENIVQVFRDGKVIQEQPHGWEPGLRGIKGKLATPLDDPAMVAVRRLRPYFDLIHVARFGHAKKGG